MKKKLILFDVDGILIKHASVGKSAIISLIKKHFGLDISSSKIPIDGKTYRRIFVEKLSEFGVEDPEKHEKFEIAMKDPSPIVEAVENGLKFEQIENVENFIKELISQNHVIALLTGNSSESARAKLEPPGLWNYFPLGAFGSESLVRGELVALAINEAEKETGLKFDKKDVFVIGDTPLDVECAKYGGVKSIAVATGRESLETLEKEKPDFVFRDFSDIDKILEAINS